MSETSWSGLSGTVRLVASELMGASCVDCHNVHAESPKRDWKVGEGRGKQEIIISALMAPNVLAFKYLLGYFVFMAALGFGFMAGAPGKTVPADHGFPATRQNDKFCTVTRVHPVNVEGEKR